MATTREALHRLLDELPEGDLPTVERYLMQLRSHRRRRLPRALAAAPIDDEPETEDERGAVAEARAQVARGEVIPDEELDRYLERARQSR